MQRKRDEDFHINLTAEEKDEARELSELWGRSMGDTYRRAVHEMLARERHAQRRWSA